MEENTIIPQRRRFDQGHGNHTTQKVRIMQGSDVEDESTHK
jgi:hypothetical protein